MTMDVKKKIIEMLEVYCDEALNKSGFKRKKNSMIYSRNIGTVKQKVEMVSFLHPSYAPNAEHIYILGLQYIILKLIKWQKIFLKTVF